MKDIAFHITDIAENSLRAGAKQVEVSLRLAGRELSLTIADNGCGMNETTLRRATDPFYTTRTTRHAGLGLPFLFQNAAQCGGGATIDSAPNRGTRVSACFRLDHIDCPPAGDLATTLALLLTGSPGVDVIVSFERDEHNFSLSSQEVRKALGEIPTEHPKAIAAVGEIFTGALADIFGNTLI